MKTFITCLLLTQTRLVASCGSLLHSHPHSHEHVHDRLLLQTNTTTTSIDANMGNTAKSDPALHTGSANELPIKTGCGTPSPSNKDKLATAKAYANWKMKKEKNGDSNRNIDRVYKVPTYFHIIQYNVVHGKVTTRQIKNGYMRWLNRAFQNTTFFFDLKGVDRVIDKLAYNCTDYKLVNVKRRLYVPGGKSLNVYVCDPLKPGLYGWASLPHFAYKRFDHVTVQNPQVAGLNWPNWAYSTFVHEVCT